MLLLARNNDSVQVAPYYSATAGVGNLGGGGSASSVELLTWGQKWRVRQPGTILKFRLYIHNLTGLTAVKVKIWRRNRTSGGGAWLYKLVDTSENILSQLTAGQICECVLTTPISGIREGDYYAVRLEGVNIPANVMYAVPGFSGAGRVHYVFNADPTGVNYNWEGAGVLTGSAIPVEIYMQAPHGILIGDSIMAAFPWCSSIEGNPSGVGIADQYGVTLTHLLSQFTNWEFVSQNVGWSGQTTADIVARFAADAEAMHPRYVILNPGINDLITSVPKATFLANYTTLLDRCAAISALPIVILIAPYTGGGTVFMQNRDDWNVSLRALAISYGAKIVNPDTHVGQFRPGGDAGNTWDIIDDFNHDDVHYSIRGYVAYGKGVALESGFMSTVGKSQIGGIGEVFGG